MCAFIEMKSTGNREYDQVYAQSQGNLHLKKIEKDNR